MLVSHRARRVQREGRLFLWRELGRIYEMQDFNPPAPETLERLRAIIDEAFGRSDKPEQE